MANLLGAALAVVLLTSGVGLAATPTPDVLRAGAVTAPTERFVVAISIDGLTPDALTELGPEGTPHLHRMLAEGAGTLNARTAYWRTKTLPNHAGMLTGRRVAGKRGHHVHMNHDPGGTVHELAGRYRSSLFDVVHDRGGSTALYASKEKFALFNRSWDSVNGSEDQVGRDHGRDKIDRYVYASPRVLVRKLVRRLQRAPHDVSFLHIRLPDDAGHEHGFMSEGYLTAVSRSDRLVGRVLDTVSSSTYLRDRVDVVLTADHGGVKPERWHGEPDVLGNYRVPFVAWGVDVAPGTDLYALNPERTDPGTGRPAYRDAPPIRNTDVASLVTTLLGFRAVPGGLLPRTTALEVS